MDQRYQVDIILLDFSKAFDTVPYQRLLKKLYNYGIRSNTQNWLSTWLTQRLQSVIVDGHQSQFVPVQSGVPQGTVLRPLMFLVYINDICGGISSNIHRFAYDCILYRVIKDELDQYTLQADFNLLIKWTKFWQMAKKCVVLRCTRVLMSDVNL